jgi:hypothetical protein
MDERLDDYDWKEAFEVSNPPTESMDGAGRNVVLREDVVEIIAMDNGYNDGDPWLMVGELKDGRFFYIDAWCDYTGWG